MTRRSLFFLFLWNARATVLEFRTSLKKKECLIAGYVFNIFQPHS